MKDPNHAQAPAKQHSIWQKTQYSNLIRNNSSGTYYARFRVLAYGGFRKSEATNVQWSDCDFARGTITVRGDPVTGTKNSESRTVPMIADMRSLLEEIRAQRPDDAPTAPVIRFKDSRKALANACEKIGIAKITHHDLRHLFATRCIESGVDIPTVSRWLGHKDGGALAMRVYGH